MCVRALGLAQIIGTFFYSLNCDDTMFFMNNHSKFKDLL